MVRLPFIKIPNVRVGGIDPTSDTSLAYGGGEAEEPTPIEYLTQWQIVGNSEVHGQEIWSCGEYNPIDGKWHIRILPEGYGVVDIALDEPLRKVDDVADKIEFADNVATVTRYLAGEVDISNFDWTKSATTPRFTTASLKDVIACPADNIPATLLCPIYVTRGNYYTYRGLEVGISVATSGTIGVYDDNYDMSDANALADFLHNIDGLCLVYALATATTEAITAPQIEEADSYSCEISQGAKAVEWSSFTTD